MLDCSALSTEKKDKKKAYKGTILVFPLRFLGPTQCVYRPRHLNGNSLSLVFARHMMLLARLGVILVRALTYR